MEKAVLQAVLELLSGRSADSMQKLQTTDFFGSYPEPQTTSACPGVVDVKLWGTRGIIKINS